MWYAVIATDKENSLADRMKSRPDHLLRLHALRDEGRLLTAGPLPKADTEDPGIAGFSGSIIVAEFGSLQEAQTWADADPYLDAGVYAHVNVTPYKKVF